MKERLSAENKVEMAKPELPRWLFWEFRYDSIDWQKAHRMVIERVLDWGKDVHVEEVIRFYGRRKVKRVLTDGCIYLMEHSLDRACGVFGVKKEDTVCYRRKVERGMGWI